MSNNKLIEQCKKYIKKGKLEQLYNYLQQNGLTQEFIKQNFHDSFNRAYQGNDLKNAIEISNFALKVSMETLSEKYGEKVANRFAEIIYNIPYPSYRNMCLFRLMNSPVKVTTQEQSDNIEKILEIASDEEHVIGTHIIGAQIGETLSREGICLTGHKFAAKDYSSNIKQEIEKNVSLYDNDPIGVVMQMIDGRGYNHPDGKFNDVMIVSIPKEELEKNADGIIIENDGNKYLSPAYIKGFMRVGTENASFEQFVDNPSFLEKRQANQAISSDEWKKQLEKWYQESNTTKMQKIKFGVINYFKRLLHKEKSIGNGQKENEK